MTIACCDPTQLPAANRGAKRQLMQPNHITIPGRSSTFAVDIDHPAVIVPASAPSATLYATPMQPANTSALADSYSSPGALFLPAPGKWFIYYDTTSALTAVLLDAYSTSAVLALGAARIQVAGGASGLSADVGDGTPNGSWAKAKNGLLVNNRTGVYDAGVSADWRAVGGAILAGGSGIQGLNAASYVGMASVAFQTGIDTSSGTLIRTAEARALDNFDAAGMTTIVGLLGAAVQYVRDAVGGTLRYVGGLKETTATPAALGNVEMRARGYWGGIRGRRFTLCLPATVIAQSGSSFSATAPVLLFVAPATNEWIIRKVRIHWVDAVTVATTKVRFVVDPDNRYSSGGVSMIPTGGFKSTSRGSAGAALTPTQARYNDGITAIVATAADDDEFHYGDLAAEDNENETIWTPDDEVIVPPSGSLLGYVWDGGGTDFTVQVELESANVE